MNKLVLQLIICLFMISCGNDIGTKSKSQVSDSEYKPDYFPVDDQDLGVDDYMVPNPAEIKKKVEEKKQSSENQKKDALTNSIHRNSTCEDLLEKYRKCVETLIKDKTSVEAKTTYKSMKNDPVVKNCRSDEKYRTSYKELDIAFYKSRKN